MLGGRGAPQESSSPCKLRSGGHSRLTERITSEQTLEEDEGLNLEDIWGKSFSSRGKRPVLS